MGIPHPLHQHRKQQRLSFQQRRFQYRHYREENWLP
ncbi:Uncharacterised protein [Vibrio cholerae]|nr:Uncharacterised protein [Vibrio cholerae]